MKTAPNGYSRRMVIANLAGLLLGTQYVSAQRAVPDDKKSTKAGQDVPVAPSPSLSPEQVVRAQLYAFKHCDVPAKDAGIRIAFAFASPANRQITGPVERFIGLVKDPRYQSILNFKTQRLEPIEVSGTHAQQQVTLLDATGHIVIYIFTLSLQSEPPFRGCWMTDGVLPMDVGKKQIAELARKSRA